MTGPAPWGIVVSTGQRARALPSVGSRTGGHPAPDSSWPSDLLDRLPGRDRAGARLALLAAVAAYRVTDADVAAVRAVHPTDADLVRLLASVR